MTTRYYRSIKRLAREHGDMLDLVGEERDQWITYGCFLGIALLQLPVKAIDAEAQWLKTQHEYGQALAREVGVEVLRMKASR